MAVLGGAPRPTHNMQPHASCRYVKNAEVEGEFYKDRQKQLQQKKERMVRGFREHQQGARHITATQRAA